MGQLSGKLRSIAYGDRPAVGFWCPGCETMHVVTTDAPRGWKFDDNHDAPTFAPSVLVTYNGRDAGQDRGHGKAPPARCHSFVRAGRIEFLSDCTHALAGQTVDLPDLPPGLTD